MEGEQNFLDFVFDCVVVGQKKIVCQLLCNGVCFLDDMFGFYIGNQGLDDVKRIYIKMIVKVLVFDGDYGFWEIGWQIFK